MVRPKIKTMYKAHAENKLYDPLKMYGFRTYSVFLWKLLKKIRCYCDILKMR